MVKCKHSGFTLLIAVIGVNVFLIMWNMADLYKHFDNHRNVEKAPNSYNLLKRFIHENLLEETTNSSDLRMKLRRILLNDSADMSWSHQRGNRAVNTSNSSMEKDVRDDSPTKKERQYLLAVMVLSTPNENGKIRRQVIRETWKKGFEAVESTVIIKFVLGTAGLAKSQTFSLESEQANHNDLLLLGSLKDGYHSLTLKVLNMLVWADNHLRFSYLLKCDEDTYVRVEAIVSELNGRKPMESLYWGYFLGYSGPSETGKFAEHNWFLCDRFLPYAMGGGYIISYNLVHIVARNAGDLQLYNNEDVSMGVWLSSYKIERKHDVRFNADGWSRGCSNKHLLTYQQSIADIRSKYQLLFRSAGKEQCNVERLRTYAYQYNWHALPSQCCRSKSPDGL